FHIARQRPYRSISYVYRYAGAGTLHPSLAEPGFWRSADRPANLPESLLHRPETREPAHHPIRLDHSTSDDEWSVLRGRLDRHSGSPYLRHHQPGTDTDSGCPAHCGDGPHSDSPGPSLPSIFRSELWDLAFLLDL